MPNDSTVRTASGCRRWLDGTKVNPKKLTKRSKRFADKAARHEEGADSPSEEGKGCEQRYRDPCPRKLAIGCRLFDRCLDLANAWSA